MPINKEAYDRLSAELKHCGATLVAVSKTKPIEDIEALYHAGQRDFGENYVQELVAKAKLLPPDIRWQFIGHLQSNKVRLIVPFVQLIGSVDSLKLLKVIDKEAEKTGRSIDCLLQVFIAREETKFGLSEEELASVMAVKHELRHVNVKGLMGMASLTGDDDLVRSEFRKLKQLFDDYRSQDAMLEILSMGMSGDYRVAIEEGSNMVRIGSLLFGARGL